MEKDMIHMKKPIFMKLVCVLAVLILAAGASAYAPASDAGKPSAAKSATGLSSLPEDAQGPISAALGKDDSGYWLRPSAGGFRGANPRQALEAEFTREGAEVRSRNLLWGLETRGYGYGDALRPAKAVAPHANANRVEYRRDGITEWYENGPLGLEQGFTLAHRPGKAKGQALTVELRLRGDLLAEVEAGGRGLELRRKDGEGKLRYTGLSARDATGRELRSWLEVRGDRLLVRVKDAGARYPVVVDPWVQQAELTASDGVANDGFGDSVAVSGSTAVVSSVSHPNSSSSPGPGAAYVFVQSGTTWSQQAELTASDGVAYDGFGFSVAVSGSTVVVGSPFHPYSGSGFGPGAAYVFVQSGTTWSQQAELTASDGAAGDQFGYSVSVSGSTALVGSSLHPNSSSSGFGPGAAYVFAQSGTMWSQQAKLTASDGAAGDQFGYSVSVSGSTALVGAAFHQVGPHIAQGAAYVFAQSGTTWSQQAELTASDGAANDGFGVSVAVSGSTALVGSPGHPFSSSSGFGPGAAYVFVQSGTTWSQQAELTASDGVAGDFFGYSVALSGGTALVGAAQHKVGSNLDQGAAYVFAQSGTTWSQQSELTASDGAAGDQFGYSVSVSGSTTVEGASVHQVGPNIGQGAAYVFGSCQVNLPGGPVSQCNSQWNQPGQLYNNTSSTICAKGCGLTSLSMALTSTSPSINSLGPLYGPNNPGDLNLLMDNEGDFGENGGVIWDYATRDASTSSGLFPPPSKGLHFATDITNPSGQLTHLWGIDSLTNPQLATSLLQQALCQGHAVIVGVDHFVSAKPCSTFPCHFVLVTGAQGNTFSIADPAGNPSGPNFPKTSLNTSGTDTSTSYGRFVMRGYVVDPSTDMSGFNVTVGNNAELLVTDPMGRQTGIDPTTLQELGQIPQAAHFADTLQDDETGASITGTDHTVQIFEPIEGTYTLTLVGLNQGNYSLGLRGYSQDSSNQPPVTLTGTIAASSTLSYQVIYNPAPGSTLQVTPMFPIAAFSSSSLTLGNQLVGTTSAAQAVTLSNSGGATLAISGISASGDFAETNNCGQSIAAGGNCTIMVTFAPSASGARTGTLTVTDSASGSPQTVALGGTGTDFSLAAASGGSTSVTVTAGQTGTYSLQVSPLSGFTGQVNLTCSGAPATTNCSVPNSVSVSSSAAPFTVSVSTTARSAALFVRPNSGAPVIPVGLYIVGAFLLLATVVLRSRGRRIRFLFFTSVLLLVLLPSCGGGGGSGGSGGGGSGTQSGTYTLKISGTQQGVNRTLNLTLTVQ
jgi:nucleoside-specific outer membrane channel protein Tsx